MAHIPMKEDGYTIIFKTMWIILSLIELYIICKFVPNKKIKIISNIGANTLNVYLLHSLCVKWLKVFSTNLFCYTEITNISIMIILTCAMLLIIGNNFVKKRIIFLTDFNKLKGKVLKKS